MALFRAKIVCNSAFRNFVFRWESCKGSVWKIVKKKLKSVHSAGPRDWISLLARDLQVAKASTHVKHAKELKSHAS